MSPVNGHRFLAPEQFVKQIDHLVENYGTKHMDCRYGKIAYHKIRRGHGVAPPLKGVVTTA